MCKCIYIYIYIYMHIIYIYIYIHIICMCLLLYISMYSFMQTPRREASTAPTRAARRPRKWKTGGVLRSSSSEDRRGRVLRSSETEDRRNTSIFEETLPPSSKKSPFPEGREAGAVPARVSERISPNLWRRVPRDQ